MPRDKALSLLSLAAKAGRVKSGEFMTETSIRDGSAFLVIVASDASENTRKQFRNSCKYYNVPFRIYSDKVSLGHCIGKEFRASLAVTGEGLALKILALLDEQTMHLQDESNKKDEVL